MTHASAAAREGRRATLQTAARKTAARLREDIVGGVLAPDRKLVLDELRRSYDVGTSPLREALAQLAAEGLVRGESQRGYWVASISLDEAADVFAMRKHLECRALDLALRDGDDTWEAEVLAAHHRLARIDDVRERERGFPSDEWERRHRVFHFALLAAARSPWTWRFLPQIYDQADRYRRVAGLAHGEQRPRTATHRDLADAVVARDRQAALDRLESHLDETAALVLDALRDLRAGRVQG
jgi:GntR family transcriptional regulator, carbon starvation induced regulator